MFWWRKKGPAAKTATNPDTDGDMTPALSPQADLDGLGPVIRQNHIAYVPAREFSGVPGVGTANLVYAPDYLLSAPAFFGGNAMLRVPNAIMIAQQPAAIVHPTTRIEGIGGLVAGQLVHQPLLEVNVSNGNTAVGE